MELGQWILYGAATFFALRSLLALMEQHRQEYKRKLAAELTDNRSSSTSGAARTPASAKSTG